MLESCKDIHTDIWYVEGAYTVWAVVESGYILCH